ncbi:hypothetical protein C8J56DRAFT_980422 [Mycena floridula]|nr:hypothetical protein C8J56DRAFT_980422 [Mycena floridula]
MFTSFVAVSLFAAAAAASTTISSACTSYMNDLNSETPLSSCMSAISTATAGSSSLSGTTLTGTLGNLCSSAVSDKCSEVLIRSTLSSFADACGDDMATNTDIANLYDTMYSVYPFWGAICAKDDNGDYCLASASSSSSAKAIENSISYTPGASNSLAPNTTVIGASNLLFMLLTDPQSSDCNTCTRKIVQPYLSFNADAPYSSGIKNSPMLYGLSDLGSKITAACGSNFFDTVVAAAGSLSSGTFGGTTSSASRNLGSFSVAMSIAFATVFVALN